MTSWYYAVDLVNENETQFINKLLIREADFSSLDRLTHRLSQCQTINMLAIEATLGNIRYEEWESLLASLVNCKLTSLLFRGRSYSADSLTLLGAFIVKNKSVETLHFSGDSNDRFANNVLIDLTHLEPFIANSSISELALEKMIIAPDSVQALIRILQKPLTAIQLSGELAKLPLILSTIPSTLKKLNLSDNTSNRILYEISELIQRTQLEALKLDNIGLSSEELQVLATSFLGGHAPRELSLNGNSLGREAGKIMAQIIQHNPTIECILASNCNLTQLDMVKIAHALPGSEIKTLNLSDNPLGNAGAMALAKVLNETNIKDLNLWGCQIHAEGALSLLACLSSNDALNTLVLNSNDFGFFEPDIFNTALSALEKNSTLTKLCVPDILDEDNLSLEDILHEGQSMMMEQFAQKNFSVRIFLDGQRLKRGGKYCFDFFDQREFYSDLRKKVMDLTRRNNVIKGDTRKNAQLIRTVFSEPAQDPNHKTKESIAVSKFKNSLWFDPALINPIVEFVEGEQLTLTQETLEENPGLKEYLNTL